MTKVFISEDNTILIDGNPAELYRSGIKKAVPFLGIDYATRKPKYWLIVPNDWDINKHKGELNCN